VSFFHDVDPKRPFQFENICLVAQTLVVPIPKSKKSLREGIVKLFVNDLSTNKFFLEPLFTEK